MTRRLAIVALLLLILSAGARVDGQQPGRVYRLGLLASSPPSAPGGDAFYQGLRERGWVEGQNLIIERRFADGKAERFPQLAQELVRLNVDVILSVGPQATHAAKEATSAIPIILVGVADPVRLGYAANLARPGGNITGLATLVPADFNAKQFELLKERVPRASRMAVIWNPTNRIHAEAIARDMPVWTQALKLTFQPLAVSTLEEIEGAFQAAVRDRADGLNVLGDPLYNAHPARFTDLATKYRLPAIYLFYQYVEAGGLLSYGPAGQLFPRAAGFVDKILRGAKPGELPIEQPTTFELAVNLKTAKALGLTVPQSILIRADRVRE